MKTTDCVFPKIGSSLRIADALELYEREKPEVKNLEKSFYILFYLRISSQGRIKTETVSQKPYKFRLFNYYYYYYKYYNYLFISITFELSRSENTIAGNWLGE